MSVARALASVALLAGVGAGVPTPAANAPPVSADATFQIGGTELAELSIDVFRRRYGAAPVSEASGLRYVCVRAPAGPYVVFDVSTVGAGLQVAHRLSEVDWRFGEPKDPLRPPARCVTSARVSALLHALRVPLAAPSSTLVSDFGPPHAGDATHLEYQWLDRLSDVHGPQDRARFLSAQLRDAKVAAIAMYETITS